MKQRHHKGRATIEYAGIKRANWAAIMRKSLGPYLGRPVSDEEIAALITVWRFDGKSGMAPIADRPMREAFARFRRDHHDQELRRRARRRTARQWLEGARFFANTGVVPRRCGTRCEQPAGVLPRSPRRRGDGGEG